jgi:hypothetical protein
MPSCRAQTSGPSDNSASAGSNVGVAAHIAAATADGPRYDPAQTPDERSAIENGIWLCQSDAKKIDDDEARYTKELLVGWRELAEERARSEQGVAASTQMPLQRTLVPAQIAFECQTATLSQEVHDFLLSIGAPLAWGGHYELVRMVLYEIALNAVKHGKARSLTAESDHASITFRDDGQPFGIDQLRAGGRGGSQAVAHLKGFAGGSFSIRSRRSEGHNEWTLVDEVGVSGANSPCSMVFEGPYDQLRWEARERIEVLDDCPEVHVYPPALWSYSEWSIFLGSIETRMNGRTLVIHGLSPDTPLVKMILSIYPQAHFPD